MKIRLSVLPLLSVFLTLPACQPGERGWCRAAKDYSPLDSSSYANTPDLGEIAVAAARIEEALPEGFDRSRAEKLITEIFIKDLSSCGRFSRVEFAEGNVSGLAVYPVLRSFSVKRENGVHKLLEIEAEVGVYRDGKQIIKKTYSRKWSGQETPDYERAWNEFLPPAMLEIRRGIIAPLSR